MRGFSLHIIRPIVLAVLLTGSVTALAAPTWEKVASETIETVETATDAYDVRVEDGAIVINLPKKTSVKIFTILGQLVAERQLEGGVWRLPISARGIYILKVGTTTRRITI